MYRPVDGDSLTPLYFPRAPPCWIRTTTPGSLEANWGREKGESDGGSLRPCPDFSNGAKREGGLELPCWRSCCCGFLSCRSQPVLCFGLQAMQDARWAVHQMRTVRLARSPVQFSVGQAPVTSSTSTATVSCALQCSKTSNATNPRTGRHGPWLVPPESVGSAQTDRLSNDTATAA